MKTLEEKGETLPESAASGGSAPGKTLPESAASVRHERNKKRGRALNKAKSPRFFLLQVGLHSRGCAFRSFLFAEPGRAPRGQ